MNLFLLLFGGKKIDCKSEYATELLDLCFRYDIAYTNFRADAEGNISFGCSVLAAKKLFRLCRAEGIEAETPKSFGVPFFFYRHRKRAGLMIGSVLALFLMVLSQRFVWDVRVTGNIDLTESEVLAELKECGFGVGSYIPNFRASELENRVLIASDRISWLAIYLDGTVATVQIIERTERGIEEDTSKPANLVAACDGQIELLQLYRGNCLVKVGQAVKKGELLVSGLYDSQTQGFRYTRAAGSVLARTERSFSVEIPLVYSQKVYEEAKRGDTVLNFFGFSMNFSKNTGNMTESCDIIEKEKELDWFGSSPLPVTLTVSTCFPYSLQDQTRTPEAALELAYDELERKLAAFAKDHQILQKSISTTLTESSLILDCTLICIEDIAIQSEFEIE